MRKKICNQSFCILVILSWVFPIEISGQQNNIGAEDTVALQQLPESYNQLKEKSAQNKWSKKLYSMLVKEPSAYDTTGQHQSFDQEFKPFEGKTIREIKIIVLEPFGTDINNIEANADYDKNESFANSLHISTKKYIIRNNLQFREGQSVNPIIIAETEAFLRSTGYINDARIKIVPDPLSEEVVDVVVVARDVWSIGASVRSLSFSSTDVELYDKNFMGMGNRVNINLLYESNYFNKFGYGAGYLYKNFMHTFIDMQASYLDDIASRQLSLSAERKLQSSLDYFGQASMYKRQLRIGAAEWDSISPDFDEYYSASLGRAFTLPSDHSSKRIVIAARYQQKMPEYRDTAIQNYIGQLPLLPYNNVKNKIWLAQISLYEQAYYRQHLIHSFGVTEDIARGYNFSTQFGYSDFDAYRDGMYASVSASGGKEYSSGYYYGESSISSFINGTGPYEGIFKMGLRYFSPLILLNKNNRIRQFINIDYARSLSKERYFDNEVYFSGLSSLNTENFDDLTKGTERFMVNTETDLFSSLNFVGFRFLFYNFIDMGWITPQSDLFHSKNFYWGTGLGIRIRNDLLVFNAIDIKIGYYPRFNQSTLNEYLNIETRSPKVSPNFVPTYPQVISLE